MLFFLFGFLTSRFCILLINKEKEKRKNMLFNKIRAIYQGSDWSIKTLAWFLLDVFLTTNFLSFYLRSGRLLLNMVFPLMILYGVIAAKNWTWQLLFAFLFSKPWLLLLYGREIHIFCFSWFLLISHSITVAYPWWQFANHIMGLHIVYTLSFFTSISKGTRKMMGVLNNTPWKIMFGLIYTWPVPI